MTKRLGTTSPTQFDPYQWADDLGIEVIYSPIRTATGMWIPEHRLIVLREGMRRVHEKCTLTHEIAHAILGHHESTPRNEWQADRAAACSLIDRDAFVEAMTYCRNLHEVAVELDVTRKLALAYVGVMGPSALPAVKVLETQAA